MKKLTENETYTAKEFLEKHKTDSLNMLGFLENNPLPDIWVNDGETDCVVMRKRNTDTFFINAYSRNSIVEAATEVFAPNGLIFFSGVRKDVAEVLFTLADKTDEELLHDDCYLYLYPEKDIDLSDLPDNVRAIDPDCAETIDYFYTYRNEHSLEKIKSEISTRPSGATYIDGEIACWSLVHEDGSMGAMFTKPQFRHKNLAVNASKFLIKQVLKRGNVPFVHIVDINEPSIKLAEKIGFVFAYPVVWFEASFENLIRK